MFRVVKPSWRRFLEKIKVIQPAAVTKPRVQLRMIRRFTTGENIQRIPLHPDYRLMQFQQEDLETWRSLLNQSGEFTRMDEKTFAKEILTGLLPGGGVFISYRDQPVACASTCYRGLYAPYAVLMYVVVLTPHRGKGLGQAVTNKVLEIAQSQGYPGMILYTDDFRIPAIKTYLKLGFQPDLEANPQTRELWERVITGIQEARIEN